MASLADEVKRYFNAGDISVKFIIVNVAVFLAVNLVLLLQFLFNIEVFDITYWLSASSSPAKLIMRPWAIITYMFLHESFWHLFWNMVILYFGGQIYAQFLGDRQFISTYVLGGISGLILYMLAYNLLPVFSHNGGIPILGASASVLALLVGIATYLPDYTVRLIFFGPVKLKYVAMIFVVLDFISIRGGNAGGHIAHIGGAIYGFMASRQLRKGTDFSDYFWNIIDAVKGFWPGQSRMRVVKDKKGKKKQTGRTSRSDYDYADKKKEEQSRIDAILDKISKSGYDSLTKEEKEFLFRASNK